MARAAAARNAILASMGEPSHRKRPLFLWVALAGLGAIVLCAGGVYAWYEETRSALERLAREQDGRLARLPRRWERPVHRGAAREGNASEMALAAAGPIPRLDDDGAFSWRDPLTAGDPIDAAHLEAARAHAAALADVRASTGAAYSARSLPLDPTAPWPSFVPVVRASQLALGLAREAPARDCLRAAADVARVGQDTTAGTGMLGLAIEAVVIEPVPRVALACGARATPDEREAAARELESIARHTPSLGAGLALEIAMIAEGVRQASPGASWLPLSLLDDDAAMRDPWTLRDAWSVCTGDEAALVALGPLDYPRAIDAVAARDARIGASGNPIVSGTELVRIAERDAAAQARLRISAVGLRALSDAGSSETLGESAPPLADDAAMADPFAAAPLRWRRTDARRARIWSVGVDRADDSGGGDDLAYDVVLAPPVVEAPAPLPPSE
jgi:hypothetical protein